MKLYFRLCLNLVLYYIRFIHFLPKKLLTIYYLSLDGYVTKVLTSRKLWLQLENISLHFFLFCTFFQNLIAVSKGAIYNCFIFISIYFKLNAHELTYLLVLNIIENNCFSFLVWIVLNINEPCAWYDLFGIIFDMISFEKLKYLDFLNMESSIESC